MPTFAFLNASQWLTPLLHRRLECSPTNYNKLQFLSFGDMLDARLLSMLGRSTSELLRTL
jgi:hypothetical protein